MLTGFRLEMIGYGGGGWFFCRIVAAEIGGGDGGGSGAGFVVGGEVKDIGERIGRAEMKRMEMGMWV